MKAFIYFSGIVLWASCHSSQNERTQNNVSTEVGSDKSKMEVEANKPTDTLLWIGIFAQWNHQPEGILDGNYDTTTNIFKFCSTNLAKKINRNQVSLLPRGNCDTAQVDRIKILIIRKDSIEFVENKAKFIELSSANPKLEIQVGNVIKTINLNQEDAHRIKMVSSVKKPETIKYMKKNVN